MKTEIAATYFQSEGLTTQQSILLYEAILGYKNKAFFGQPKEIVNPLIKRGLLHKDTYKFTGGAKATKIAVELFNKLKTAK